MNSSRLGLLPLTLLLVGCAGRTDPAADTINLVLSEPTGGTNVNLTRFDTGNDWQRSRPGGTGLTITVRQAPGPTGLSSRQVSAVIANAVVGTDYSLNAGGVNYLELTENSTTGARAWRSESGGMRLIRDETKISEIQLTNIVMAPQSGNALGKFKIEGPIIIRF